MAGRIVVISAALVTAVLAAALGVGGAAGSVTADATAQAAPPPAFVVAAAVRMARGLGDATRTAAQYVLTRHEAAVRASSGATVRSDQLVYLVVLTGDFRTGLVGPAPGGTVSGSFASEVLDADSGRDTDFAIGSQPIPIRSVGLVGNLLPYMRGKAQPACGAPDLAASAAFQGATGSQFGGITITNRSTLACALPAMPQVRLVWNGRPLAVKTTVFPAGWLRRMNPRWGERVSTLVPGGRAQVILQWFNWCGPTPWGRDRGFHLSVDLLLPHQPRSVEATTRELVLSPYCNEKPAAGSGSTVRVSPFVKRS